MSGISLGTRVHSREIERVLAPQYGAGLLLGASASTVGHCLARLPDRYELLRRGASDVQSALDAAGKARTAQTAFRRAMSLGDNAAAIEASALMIDATRQQHVLVDGTLDGTTFTLFNGTKVVPVLHKGMPVVPGDHVWAILNALTLDDGRDAFHVSWVGPYETVYLPRYADDSHAICFARSRLLRLLLLELEWPESHSPELQEKLRALLWCAHCPPDRETASNIENPDFVNALRGYFEGELEEESSEDTYPGPPEMPAPRLVKTARQAEEYAAEVMVALGFDDAEPTVLGADGGIDVDASQAIAQVKMEGLPTGRPPIQALSGIAHVEGKTALFFSLAGYTPQAIAWAERADVACFEFAFDGTIEAVSKSAHNLLEYGAR